MALSEVLNMSLDYLIYGKESSNEKLQHTDEVAAILNMLDNADARSQKYAKEILKLFYLLLFQLLPKPPTAPPTLQSFYHAALILSLHVQHSFPRTRSD